MGITPSNLRLLQGLRATLQGIASGSNALDDRTRLSLRAADVVLNELLLREERAFLAELFAELRTLVHEGAALLPEHQQSIATELSALPTELDAGVAFDVGSRAVASVLGLLDRQVQLLAGGPKTSRDFLRRVVDAESRLYFRRAQQAAMPEAAARRSFTAADFERYLAARFPERGYKVTAFRELVGGFQKTTILVTLEERNNAVERIVVRAEKPEVFLQFDCSEVQKEYEIVRIAHAAGVPVAEPLWVEADPAALGMRFMVSRELKGGNAGDQLGPRQLSDAEARDVVRVLAKIHSVPLDDRIKRSPVGHWLQHAHLRDNTLALVRSWREQIWVSRSHVSLAARRLSQWLVDNVPQEDAPPRLLHVDYGPHNLMFHESKVSGVLDWESARIGDPAEDLSDLLARFAGTIDRNKAIAWYREAGGDEISEYRLRYFDAFNNIKPIIASLSAGTMFELQPGTPLEWCLLPLQFCAVSRDVEEKIAAAEAAKSGPR
jgi:aminoglycoside phosphotransferase (APT) family kinase protein